MNRIEKIALAIIFISLIGIFFTAQQFIKRYENLSAENLILQNVRDELIHRVDFLQAENLALKNKIRCALKYKGGML